MEMSRDRQRSVGCSLEQENWYEKRREKKCENPIGRKVKRKERRFEESSRDIVVGTEEEKWQRGTLHASASILGARSSGCACLRLLALRICALISKLLLLQKTSGIPKLGMWSGDLPYFL